jgi:hypothetical protein
MERGVTMSESNIDNKSILNEVKSEARKKKGFWNGFLTFLMMGGFIVILIAIVAILVGVSLLMNSCNPPPAASLLNFMF